MVIRGETAAAIRTTRRRFASAQQRTTMCTTAQRLSFVPVRSLKELGRQNDRLWSLRDESGSPPQLNRNVRRE
eukprot:3507497-Lingulodinium_polyedra.AAC.1